MTYAPGDRVVIRIPRTWRSCFTDNACFTGNEFVGRATVMEIESEADRARRLEQHGRFELAPRVKVRLDFREHLDSAGGTSIRDYWAADYQLAPLSLVDLIGEL